MKKNLCSPIMGNDDELKALIEETIMKAFRTKCIEKYNILQNKRGLYYTYIREPDGKRKQVSKKSYDELVDYLVRWERSLEGGSAYTLAKLYPAWIKAKELEAPTVNNARRLRDDWNRYYAVDPIITRAIDSISVQEWYEWKITKIKSMHLTAKQKTNMNTVANGIYDYAIRLGYTNTNTSRAGGRGIAKVLTDVNEKKRERKDQTFSKTEVSDALTWIESEFSVSRSIHKACLLALGANFFLGLRVGELAALTTADVHDGKIHVHSQEVENYPDGVHRDGFVVAPYTKKNRVRAVPISQSAQTYLDKIYEFRRSEGLTCEYLVCDTQNRRIPAYVYEKYMHKLCDGIGTPRKGNHGIRKAVISMVANVDLSLASVMAGHKSKQTTLDHYVFNQDSDDEIRAKLDNIFSTESRSSRSSNE